MFTFPLSVTFKENPNPADDSQEDMFWICSVYQDLSDSNVSLFLSLPEKTSAQRKHL